MSLQDKSNQGLVFIIPLLILLVFLSGCSPETPYEIDGDSVLVNNDNLYLKVTPHTLYGNGWVETEFKSKSYSGDIDFIFGFDLDTVKPKEAQIYSPHNVTEWRHYYCNYDFNYTLNPNYFWCYTQVGGENVILFEHSFISGDIQNAYANWTEDVLVEWRDWNPDGSLDYEYAGMNKWYYARNKAVLAGETYKLRYYLNVPFMQETKKYILAIKPSSETIPEAIANGHLYMLDPWFDTTYGYKTEINLSTTQYNATHYPLKIIFNTSNINYNHTKDDGGDLRFLNSSETVELDYYIERWNESGRSIVYVNVSNQETRIYVYYNKSTATTTSNLVNTFGEDFMEMWTTNNESSNVVPLRNKDLNMTIGGNPQFNRTINKSIYETRDGHYEFDGNDWFNRTNMNGSYQVWSSNGVPYLGFIRFRQDDTTAGEDSLIINHNTVSGFISIALSVADGEARLSLFNGTYAKSVDTTTAGVVHDIAFRGANGGDGGKPFDLMLDGKYQSSGTTGVFATVTGALCFGSGSDGTNCNGKEGLDGMLDEIILYKGTEKSTDWIAQMHRQQNLTMSGGAFLGTSPYFNHGALNWSGNASQNISVDFNCSDVEGGTITYNIINMSNNITGTISINTTNGNVSGDPGIADNGLYPFNVTCTDGVWTNSTIFNVTVISYPPTIPSTFSPTNDPYYMNSEAIDLTCSGASSPIGGALNYTFFRFTKPPVNISAYTGAGGGTFTEGSGYTNPHVLAVPGLVVDHTVTTTMQIRKSQWIIDFNVTDAGGNLGYFHIYLDGVDTGENQIYATTAAKVRSNTTLNISDTFLDGRNHTVSFKLTSDAGADGQDAQFWWDQTIKKEIIANSSNTTITMQRPMGNWSCEAYTVAHMAGPESLNRSVIFANFSHAIGTTYNKYINFTFRDELNSSVINATANFNFNYTLGGEHFNYAYDSSTKENLSYAFKFVSEPMIVGRPISNSISVLYSSLGYESRLYQDTLTLTLPGTNKTLYLLLTASGSYVSFHVLDTAGNFLSGVNVDVEKKIGGVWTSIASGVTDDTGTVQFFMYPTSEHRLTFTKGGFGTKIFYVFPSEANYYITMGATTNITYVPVDVSLVWGITPQSGLLNPNSVHDFTFNLTSNTSSILECRMMIIANNTQSHVLYNQTGCPNSWGGMLNTTINISASSSLDGFYYANTTNSSGAMLLSTAHWEVLSQNATSGTLKQAFEGLKDWNAWGTGTKAAFSRVWFFFIMMAVVIGLLTYSTSIEFNNPGSVIIIIIFMIGFASYTGMFQIDAPGIGLLNRNVYYEKWAIFLTSLFLSIGYFLNHIATRRGA